jgi:hypothetical protein
MLPLSSEERQKLIDLLCRLPGIGHINTRYSLVATLPSDLQNNIEFNDPIKVCITSIVDMVSSDAWCQLIDGSYPILVVIQNAMYMVRRSKLEIELMILMNKICTRLGLSLLDTPSTEPLISPLAIFMQKLDDLINLLSTFEDELESISDSFKQHIYQLDCVDASNHLIRICGPIRTFSTYLIRSDDLPQEVIPLRFGLMSSLKSLVKQEGEIEKCISAFCAMYGAEKEQPSEKRMGIQQQLNILRGHHGSVLDEAEKLQKALKR